MNNIEKKLRKRGMQKLNKFAHNPYHKPFIARMPLWTKIAVPASLMTAVTCVAFFGLINGLGGARGGNAALSHQSKYEPDYSSALNNETTNKGGNDNSSSAPNDGSGDNNRFLTFEGKTYTFMPAQFKGEQAASDEWGTVPNNKIGNLLGQMVVNQGTSAEDTVGVYAINDYSPDAFVAMKYASNSSYYACCNQVNTYSTIGDFLTQIPFMSDSTIKSGSKIMLFDDTEDNKYYTGADVATINSYLFTDTSATITTSFMQAPGENSITIPFVLKTFSSECVKITLYGSGYMQIKVGIDAPNDKNIYKVDDNMFSNVLTYIQTLTQVGRQYSFIFNLLNKRCAIISSGKKEVYYGTI